MLRGAAPPFVLNRRHVVKSSTNLAISLASRTVRGLLCRTGAKGIGRQQLTRECGARAAARDERVGDDYDHDDGDAGLCY
jgi:hypothetical protein